MKIKVPFDLLLIDILSILLILSITFFPITIARVILGLPFLLFFPGYVLVSATLPKGEMNHIERFALSFGTSIVVTALIAAGLNFTPWGIKLETVLYSIFAFIFIFSLIAIARRRSHGRKNFNNKINLQSLGFFQGSPLNKMLNVILIIVIFATIGIATYTIAKPKIGQKFSEFYILGNNGMAEKYPTNFVLNSEQAVISVQYGNDTPPVSEKSGRLMVDIVNNENVNTLYTIVMWIDGTQVDIPFQGNNIKSIGPIEMAPGEKWEQQIGIVPHHAGQNQEVELLLYKNNGINPYLNLHLFINVREQ